MQTRSRMSIARMQLLTLESGYSVISGVKNLELSNPQRVALVPVGGQLFVKGNRNVDFDGQRFCRLWCVGR